MDLYEACENGNEERVVEILLDAFTSSRLHANHLLRTRGTAGRTPLIAACLGAELGVARLLLGESCVVYFTSRQQNDTEVLLQPLAQAYGPSEYFTVSMATKPDGGTALVPVATVRFPPAWTIPSRDLLDGKTHVDDFGNTPLQCVSCFGCGTTESHLDDGVALARELLKHGDQPNVPKIANHWTPLHWAAYHGHHELCSLLLDPVDATNQPLNVGKTQLSVPLLVNDDLLFAADVAGRRGLALATEMKALHAIPTTDHDDYARWRLRLDHITTLRLFTREFLRHAKSVVRYVDDMNARLPSETIKRLTHADAIRYGQHLLYWMGCFGLEDDVRALLELELHMPADGAGGSTVVHLRPLYVCSCEENKRQSVLHAVALHGQPTIVRLLLTQMLVEQQQAPSTSLTLELKSAERPAINKKTAVVAPTVPTPPSESSPNDTDATKLDVLPLVPIGWRNYRNETPLYLAVLFLQDQVVETFSTFLSSASLAWELKNCNVEGSYIHHVASVTARHLLGVEASKIRLVHAEYVLLLDGLTKRAFKESIIEAMREESVLAPSLRVTQVGIRHTPPSWHTLWQASCTDYIVVGATDQVLVRHAQALQLKIKHRGSTVRSAYNAATPTLFEPFRSLQRQQVVLDIIQKNINVQKHVRKHNLQAIFPLHDISGCKNIMRHWVRTDNHRRVFQPFVGTSFVQFARERRTHQYEMLWPLLTYLGEKHAFYYAFLLFYTVWLVVLAIPGLLCQVAWSFGHARYVTPLFAIFTSLWATLFVERWKRKRSEIQSTFGRFKRNRSELAPSFYGDFQVDAPERSIVDTTFPKSLQLVRVYAGLPLLLTMAGLAVALFVGVKLNASSTAILTRLFPWFPPPFSTYIIPIVNAVCMLVLDTLYTYVAMALTQWENHRTVWEFESMLATKLFWFKFLNAFISLFWVAFVDRDAIALRKQLVITMGARQIWYMIQRSVFPLLKVARAWQHAGFALDRHKKTSWFSITHEWYNTELVEPVQGENDTAPPPMVQLQELMQPADFLLGKHIEVVLHFGYITMFVSVLPVAPLLALGSVVVSTRLDVACCTQAKRRPPFESETEVATLMSILEFMSFAAVAVNCAVLFFTTMDDLDSFLALAGTPQLVSSNVTLAEAHLYKLWWLLVLEHIVLGIKALLSLTIDDAASWVQNDEDREGDPVAQLHGLRVGLETCRPTGDDEFEQELSFGDAAGPPGDEDIPPEDDESPRASSALDQVLSDKYHLVVTERDVAVARERHLHQQLHEYRQRIDDLVSTMTTQTNGSKPRSQSTPTAVLVSPRVKSMILSRGCWICGVFHAHRATTAQKRCLTCRRFFCRACDEIVHLDDLGVREPKHFRVNARVSSTSSEKEEHQFVSRESSTDEDLVLRNLLIEYLSQDADDVDPTAVETLLHRCVGSEALVVRYLRNMQRQRAFRCKDEAVKTEMEE